MNVGGGIGPRGVARVLGAAQTHDVADLGAAAGERGGELFVGAEEDAALAQLGSMRRSRRSTSSAMVRSMPSTRVTHVRMRSRSRVKRCVRSTSVRTSASSTS